MNGEMSEDTKDLVSKAVRDDQRVKAEDLVANELATAVLSEPMLKIRHTYEALMLLDEDERKAANITDEEVEEGEKIYELCQTLQNAFIDTFTDQHGNEVGKSATIPWPSPQEDAPERLDWLSFITWRLYKANVENQETYEEASKLADDGKIEESLYIATEDRVTMDTLNRLKAQFINHTMPKAARLLKKIIKVVSSSSFQAAMDRIKGGATGGGRKG